MQKGCPKDSQEFLKCWLSSSTQNYEEQNQSQNRNTNITIIKPFKNMQIVPWKFEYFQIG